MLKQFIKSIACSVRDWAAQYAESDDNQPNITTFTATSASNNGDQMVLLPVFDQHGVRIGSHMVPSGPTILPQSHKAQPGSVTAQHDRTWPAKLTPFIPSHPQPESETRFDQGVVFTSFDKLNEGVWPVWPSGRFALDISHQDFENTKKLQVLWATQNSSVNGGKGSVESPTTCGGKVSCRKCLGALKFVTDYWHKWIENAEGGKLNIDPRYRWRSTDGGDVDGIQDVMTLKFVPSELRGIITRPYTLETFVRLYQYSKLRWLVSRKRTRNLFDLASSWNKVIRQHLEDDASTHNQSQLDEGPMIPETEPGG
ncbi:hypothetical protein BT96DRAFT_935061 [Gymnopus androsaceus JB14]|uniref:Uncharacterized protein n=1 Tax=Gymnopus androsaceus JB14 TaxID=1447944 RepID=A0A6A4I8F2_9AGAR|nr:hypothetical protein BT96DRAFT_935061 [Gymnopus androsaceus JB14]